MLVFLVIVPLPVLWGLYQGDGESAGWLVSGKKSGISEVGGDGTGEEEGATSDGRSLWLGMLTFYAGILHDSRTSVLQTISIANYNCSLPLGHARPYQLPNYSFQSRLLPIH